MLVITGAAGFLGSATVRAAVDAGFSVLPVSRRQTAALNGGTVVRVGNYAELQPPPDAILIHLAEPRDIQAADADGAKHEAATVGLLKCLLDKSWRFVVYASSVAVYGDITDYPRSPLESLLPATAYGRAKLVCESLVTSGGGAVARLANLYGPGMARNCVLADILAQIPGKGPLFVQTSDPVRDYLWIDDAAAALLAIATKGISGVFNVGRGESLSVAHLAETVLRIAGESSRPIVARREMTNPSVLRLDISDTVKRVRWVPKTSIEEGVLELLKLRAT